MHPADDEDGARDRYYIRTSANDLPRLVVKCDEAFFVADNHGDFPELPESEFGFYVGGTRFLRTLELAVHGQRPIHLNAAVSDDGSQVAVDLTNPDLCHGEVVGLRGRLLRLARRLVLEPTALVQILIVESFSPEPHELILSWHYLADFADVFEVRGMVRERRGAILPPAVDGASVRLSYRGLDDVVRVTALSFDPPPEKLTEGFARHRLVISPGESHELRLIITTAEGDDRLQVAGGGAIVPRVVARVEPAPGARVRTANVGFDEWVARSWSDLRMLSTETPHGRIAYAGIPWYVAPFGRDSIITALQHLPFDPGLARGTIRFLAAYQGHEDDEFTDQNPGKILHEYRRGEMAACREIVFIPYYGSVDATPLFLMLVAEYLRWTDDRALLAELEPAIEAALDWTERSEYVTYASRSARGLVNQGWKDSHDAIMHRDGRAATGPIALVEVQGYKYAALEGAARIAERLGRPDLARTRRAAGQQLRERFLRDFWMEDEGFYALALDGDGEPCRVASSNPAHALWTGLVPPDRGARIAERLLKPDLFSGWGIRTLGTQERLYNPMSYHNGSVWPHDTAIAAAGLRRYGFTGAFLSLANGLFDAAQHCEGHRLPELFCGFPRASGYGPTPYPVACSPQAWAAGVVSQLLAGMLGIEPDAEKNRLIFRDPVLPEWLPRVEVRGLRIRDSTLDVLAVRTAEGAVVEVLEQRGDAEIALEG
jgi:glycogen debranching enzyme